MAAKSASEAVEETASASEGEVSVSESSSYNTPLVLKAKQPREPLSKVAIKYKNNISRVEPERANCLLVIVDEWEELRNLMAAAVAKMELAVERLKTYVKRDSKMGNGSVRRRGDFSLVCLSRTPTSQWCRR